MKLDVPPLVTTEDPPLLLLIGVLGFVAGLCIAVLGDRTLSWAKERHGYFGRLFRFVVSLGALVVIIVGIHGFDRGQDGIAMFIGLVVGLFGPEILLLLGRLRSRRGR